MLDQERSKILCQVIMVLLHTMCSSCKTSFFLMSLPVRVRSLMMPGLQDRWIYKGAPPQLENVQPFLSLAISETVLIRSTEECFKLSAGRMAF